MLEQYLHLVLYLQLVDECPLNKQQKQSLSFCTMVLLSMKDIFLKIGQDLSELLPQFLCNIGHILVVLGDLEASDLVKVTFLTTFLLAAVLLRCV